MAGAAVLAATVGLAPGPIVGPAAADEHSGPAVPRPPAGTGADQTLVFADEFDDGTVDRGKWSTRNREADPNVEGKSRFLAWYPQAEDEGVSNVSEGGGSLTVRADDHDWYPGQPWGQSYGTGIVQSAPGTDRTETQPGFQFRYGYVEARIQGPAADARGTDAGLWLYSRSGWPPEIDVVEMPGSQAAGKVQINHHWNDGGHRNEWHYAGVRSDQWHTYGLRWEPNLLVWYVDGTEIYRSSTGVPQDPMFVNLAIEIGGGPGDTFFGDPAAGAWPQRMNVDWIRLWQDGGAAARRTADER
ncbi:hypothetical protein GCM10010446_60970 [Streptomyces enissocaesilis]|uniref:licheninase n=1 Tax=Streptomyces enissocaesilis TaxID=332589 RepID=A0ABP6K6S0_9ACTN